MIAMFLGVANASCTRPQTIESFSFEELNPAAFSCGDDCDRPVVIIASPRPDQNIDQVVRVSGTAQGATPIARVEVQVDDLLPVLARGSTHWTLSLNATELAEGRHRLSARAWDEAGSFGATSLWFRVSAVGADGPPSLSIEAPSAGAPLSGPVWVSGVSADDQGVARVEVAINGGAYQPASGTSPWGLWIDTRAVPDGARFVFARATDTAGNARIVYKQVIIKNDLTPPTVQIVSPSSGILSGPILIVGTAADDSAVTRVEVQLGEDGGPVYSASGTTEWSARVNPFGVIRSAGPVTLVARAFDASGNRSEARLTLQASPTDGLGALVGSLALISNPGQQPGMVEPPFGGRTLELWSSHEGRALQHLLDTRTDGSGGFSFLGLPEDEYQLRLAEGDWVELSRSHVPSGGARAPRWIFSVRGQVVSAHLGLRPVIFSADPNVPLSNFVGPNGLEVRSWTDAVGAREVYERVVAGFTGGEVRYTRVSVGAPKKRSLTTVSVASTDSCHEDFLAQVNVAYTDWAQDPSGQVLSHEYGHAWSYYQAWMVQQESSSALFEGYLRIRGLSSDSRLETGFTWFAAELIAEDYRVLLGAPEAGSTSPANAEIPPADQVPELRDFLRDTFSTVVPFGPCS